MASQDNQGISDFQALTNAIASVGSAVLPAVLNKGNAKADAKAKQQDAANAAAAAKAAAAAANKNKIFGMSNEVWFVVGGIGVVILVVAFLMKKK